jgi:hypothetical protein
VAKSRGIPNLQRTSPTSRTPINTNQELDFRNPSPKSSLSSRFNSNE